MCPGVQSRVGNGTEIVFDGEDDVASVTIYRRDRSTGAETIDRWSDGVGWIAHPDERGRRASHAIRGEDGVWILDPVDAAGVEDAIADLGDVAGVAVLFDWHARDADVFARRYGVPVTVPAWLDRVAERTDAPIERCGVELGDSGFELRRWTPMPGWREALCVRESDRTLYVPESLATADPYTVGDERVGLDVSQRLFPPRDLLDDVDPARILVGHGEGLLESEADHPGEVARALEYALAGARRRLPRALVENGPTQVRSVVAAMRD